MLIASVHSVSSKHRGVLVPENQQVTEESQLLHKIFTVEIARKPASYRIEWSNQIDEIACKDLNSVSVFHIILIQNKEFLCQPNE